MCGVVYNLCPVFHIFLKTFGRRSWPGLPGRREKNKVGLKIKWVIKWVYYGLLSTAGI